MMSTLRRSVSPSTLPNFAMKTLGQNLVRKLGGASSAANTTRTNLIAPPSLSLARDSLLPVERSDRQRVPMKLLGRPRVNEQINGTSEVVDLSYECFGPDISPRNRVKALIIVHGLLCVFSRGNDFYAASVDRPPSSSSELWRSLARSLAERIQLPVYAIVCQ